MHHFIKRGWLLGIGLILCLGAISSTTSNVFAQTTVHPSAELPYVHSDIDSATKSLRLTWQPNTKAETILGYDVEALNNGVAVRLTARPVARQGAVYGGLQQTSVSLAALRGTPLAAFQIVGHGSGGRTQTYGPYNPGVTYGQRAQNALAVAAPHTSIAASSADVGLLIRNPGIYHLSADYLSSIGVDLNGTNLGNANVCWHNKPLAVYSDGSSIEFEIDKLTPGSYTGQDTLDLSFTQACRSSKRSTPLPRTMPGYSMADYSLPNKQLFWLNAPAGYMDPWADYQLANVDASSNSLSLPITLPYYDRSNPKEKVTMSVTVAGDSAGLHNLSLQMNVPQSPTAHAQMSLKDYAVRTQTLSATNADLKYTVVYASATVTTPVVQQDMPFDAVWIVDWRFHYPRSNTPDVWTSVDAARQMYSPTYVQKALAAAANTGKKVDMLILSAPDSIPALTTLADYHRQHDGFGVAVLDVNAVYDAYSKGNIDPKAIRTLLAVAQKKFKTQYVILNGTDSVDPHNWAATLTPPAPSSPAVRMPSLSSGVDSESIRYVSDDFYVAGLGNMVIGRFPTSSAADTAALVAKSLQFAQTRGDVYNATFVTDSDPTLGDTSGYTAQTIASLHTPASTHIQQIGWTPGDPGDATSRIVSDWQTPTRLVQYVGHSNPTVWSDDGVFSTDQALQVNGTPGMLMQFSCWGAQYDGAFGSSIAKALETQAPGGSAIMVGYTAEEMGPPLNALTTAFYSQLTGPVRIGDALFQARKTVMATHPSWTDMGNALELLGDPALFF